MRPALLALALATIVAAIAQPATAVEAKLTPELTALVEAERSFSRTSGERGIRDAFLAYFADDAISFEPEPGPAIARIRAWPAPTRPGLLAWDPVFVDLSRAGDMGYTTGPTRSEDLGADPRPIRYGYYFSVWRKQADGNWKVAIDAGIGTPGAETPGTELRAAGSAGHAAGERADVAAARVALFALEREPGTDAHHLAEGTRLHRDGSFPIIGHTAVMADLAHRAGPSHCEPADVVVAASADVAFSYGSYTRAATDEAAAKRGHYLHVWKRAAGGDWEIVAQIEQAP